MATLLIQLGQFLAKYFGNFQDSLAIDTMTFNVCRTPKAVCQWPTQPFCYKAPFDPKQHPSQKSCSSAGGNVRFAPSSRFAVTR